jgi:hypothetical protein
MRVANGIPLSCSLPLTGWHCKLRPNTEGAADLLNTFVEQSKTSRRELAIKQRKASEATAEASGEKPLSTSRREWGLLQQQVTSGNIAPRRQDSLGSASTLRSVALAATAIEVRCSSLSSSIVPSLATGNQHNWPPLPSD